MKRTLLALFLVAALVAAACGSDDSGGEDSSNAPDGGEATEEATDSPTEVDTPSATETATVEESATEEATPTEEIELTATDRGVTADAITVAVTQIDLDELRALDVVQTNHGDYELIYQTLIDDINARGGINGREVEMVYGTYLPLGNAEAEALCIELVEDEEVFAVLSGLLGDPLLCITEQNETISIGGGQVSDEIIERSEGRLIIPDAATSRGTDLTFAALDEAGVLEGETIAIHAGYDGEANANKMRDLLEGAGYEVSSVTIASDTGGDVEAGRVEFETVAERYRADGVTALVMMPRSPNVAIEGVARAGLDLDLYAELTASPEVSATGRDFPEETRGVVTVAGLLEGPEQMADPLMQECIDVFSAANPDIEIPEMRSVEPGDPDWAIGIRIACWNVALFEMIAAAAGPELTTESFVAAAEGLGSFALAAQPFNSLGPGKLDANDTVRLVEFDPDTGPSGGFVALTDVVDATP